MLSFALTVHRAQGQTLEYVHVDCASFFAAGQLGVSIGRVKTKAGLRVRNLNRYAANLKHLPCVYQCYDQESSTEPMYDLSCCNANISMPISAQSNPTSFDEPQTTTTDDFEIDIELPKLQHPWSIDDFLIQNKGSSFLSCVSVDFIHSIRFEEHVQFLYFKVYEITLLPFGTSKPQQWNTVCASINQFLIGDLLLNVCRMLFQTNDISKQNNKLSTKLMLWLLDNHIDKKTMEIVDIQTEKAETKNMENYSAGKAKIRYLAGACVCKISKKLKDSVLSNIGKTSKKSKITRKFDYKMQVMLKIFRINENEAPQDDSMNEISSKQGPSRGLTIINDEVLTFFLNLNTLLQKKTTFE
jgi:hypothetical protein